METPNAKHIKQSLRLSSTYTVRQLVEVKHLSDGTRVFVVMLKSPTAGTVPVFARVFGLVNGRVEEITRGVFAQLVKDWADSLFDRING